MKLTTAIAGTLLMLTTSLTASFATDKNACGEERQLVTALYRQISAQDRLAAAIGGQYCRSGQVQSVRPDQAPRDDRVCRPGRRRAVSFPHCRLRQSA